MKPNEPLYQPLAPNELAALMSDRPKPENVLTIQDLRDRITAIWFTTLETPEGVIRKTICTIKLDNGFEVDGESVVIDPENFNHHLGQHFAYQQAFNKLWEFFALLRMEEDFKGTHFIKLNPDEVQSNHSRVKWAEGLINQLPETHDGRNSWLLNYGRWREGYKLSEGSNGEYCFRVLANTGSSDEFSEFFDSQNTAWKAAFSYHCQIEREAKVKTAMANHKSKD